MYTSITSGATFPTPRFRMSEHSFELVAGPVVVAGRIASVKGADWGVRAWSPPV